VVVCKNSSRASALTLYVPSLMNGNRPDFLKAWTYETFVFKISETSLTV